MNKKEIAKIKEELLKKRTDILRIVKKTGHGFSSEVGDSVDIASDSVERELLFELTDNERLMLQDIENALQKIEEGLFGKCESCSNGISTERLKVMPFARYCIECQAKSESQK